MQQTQLKNIAASVGLDFHNLTKEQKTRLDEAVKATLRLTNQNTGPKNLSDSLGVPAQRFDEIVEVVDETSKAVSEENGTIVISELAAVSSNHAESAGELFMIGFYIGCRTSAGKEESLMKLVKMIIQMQSR
jgi:hypothetical protein